jgi:hypothetical protein
MVLVAPVGSRYDRLRSGDASAFQKAARISLAPQALARIRWAVDVGDERPMGCREGPQGLVQLGEQVQRLRPGRQAQAAGVTAAVAGVVSPGCAYAGRSFFGSFATIIR